MSAYECERCFRDFYGSGSICIRCLEKDARLELRRKNNDLQARLERVNVELKKLIDYCYPNGWRGLINFKGHDFTERVAALRDVLVEKPKHSVKAIQLETMACFIEDLRKRAKPTADAERFANMLRDET